MNKRPDDREFLPIFAVPHAPWHAWFAWHPVNTIDRGWVWLSSVWRRKVSKKHTLPGPPGEWWQHVKGEDQ